MKDSGIKWIGLIPKDWSIQKGKYVLRYLQRRIRPDDGVITCFRDGEVTLRTNRREDGFTLSDKEIGYQGVDIGDLVVHGMDGFAGAIGISDSRGKASPVLNVLDSYYNKRFLMYYLRSMAFGNVFLALATGIRVRSCDLRWNKLATLPYPIPPLPEQQKISDFLDEKCSEIDSLSADIQTQIDTLEEYKKSIITEAVTKGLNPNVEMKDSGVQWIGKIPKKWSVIPVKFCFLITNGSDPKTKEGSTPVYGSGASSFKTCVEYKKGPTVLLGRKGTVNIPQWIEGKYWNVDTAFDVHPLGNYALKLFYYCSICFDYDNYSTQTALPSMTQATYLNFRIPFMEKSQQDEIVLFLDNKCSEIEKTISEKQQQLETLEEYKKSLIYEYVTGKKEIA